MEQEIQFNRDYMELLYDFDIKNFADFCVKHYPYCLSKGRLDIFEQLKKELFHIMKEDRYYYHFRKDFNYLFNTSFFAFKDMSNIQILNYIKNILILNNEPLDYRKDVVQDFVDMDGKSPEFSVGLMLSTMLSILFRLRKFTLVEYNQVFKNTILLSHNHLPFLEATALEIASTIKDNHYKRDFKSLNYGLKHGLVSKLNIGIKDILTKKVSLDDLETILKTNTKKSKIGIFFSYTIRNILSTNKQNELFSLKWLNNQDCDVSIDEMDKLYDDCLKLITKYADYCVIVVNGQSGNIDMIRDYKKYVVNAIYEGTSNGYMRNKKISENLFPFTAVKLDSYNNSPIYKYIESIISTIEDDYLNLSEDRFSSIYNKNIKEFIEQK